MNRTVLTILFLNLFLFSQSQTTTLFSDDFESGLDQWTLHYTPGMDYWYPITDEGVSGSNCIKNSTNMVAPYAENDSWIISPEINTQSLNSASVQLATKSYEQGIDLELYYSFDYSGNFESANWNKIEVTDWNNTTSWSTTQKYNVSLEGQTSLYFAIRYQTTLTEASIWWVDNFSFVYTEENNYELTGTSDHFNYYTNITDSSNYYLKVQDALEQQYDKLTSIWNRPNIDNLYPDDSKISVIFTTKENIPLSANDSPSWKCGFFDKDNNTIYLSPLNSFIQKDYYKSTQQLAINTFSQLTLIKKLIRDERYYHPDYFMEGFGLYETGYRAQRDSLMEKFNDLETQEPKISDIEDTTGITNSSQKDLIVSYIESQILVDCYYHMEPGYREYEWQKYLKYYHINQGDDQVKLIYSTEHFDFYAQNKELANIDNYGDAMENQYNIQNTRYDLNIKHRFNICIYDFEVGNEIMNRTDFCGQAFGGDRFQTLPIDGSEGYGLANHEFMHNLVSLFNYYGPGQFLNEGIAVFSEEGPMTDEELPYHIYKIEDTYYHFLKKYGREPTYEEVFTNSEAFVSEDPYWIDVYGLGFMFWTYMYDKYHDYKKFQAFITDKWNWSVFSGQTNEQESNEFFQYWKELAHFGPPLEKENLPFSSTFNDTLSGWTYVPYKARDIWEERSSGGIDNSRCAGIYHPYFLDDKEVDTWLITPTINTENVDKLELSFSFYCDGSGIEPELYYSNNFNNVCDNVTWIKIDNFNWDSGHNTWSTESITIDNTANQISIAIRYQSSGDMTANLFIDDFSVKDYYANNEPNLEINEPLTVDNASTTTITDSYLSASDDESFASEIEFIITQQPQYGQIENTDNTGSSIQSFSQQEVNDQKIAYVHDGSSTTSDQFVFNVSDGTNTISNNTFSIVINAATSINNIENNFINIWPTAIDSKVEIESKNCMLKEVKVYDVNGRCALSKELNTLSTELNCSILNSGMYLFVILTDKSQVVRKLIKK
ncbi:MAG: hypothetical protein PWP52_1293 [Bacteroidales bacterium]|nr:hypothetical protein [Bacteroidales bacterium]